MELGDVIKVLHQKQGYTQKQLAISANVAQSAISYAENNTREPTIDVVRKLCMVFNISMSSFFELVDGCGNIDISPIKCNDISEFELNLIKKIRCLPNDERTIVVSTIDAFAKNSPKAIPTSSILSLGDRNMENSGAV